MKKLVLVAVLLLGFSVMAMAQDTPVVEVFGGYSLLLVDTTTASGNILGEDLHLNLNGWNTSIAINGSKWAGFVAEFSGLYGTAGDVVLSGEDALGEADVRVHSVMVGPRITLHRGAVTPFVQALLGFAHITASRDGDLILRENDLAMALGGGLDVNLNNRVAIRPVQLDYFTTRTGVTGHFADHFRFSTGVVFKLGKR